MRILQTLTKLTMRYATKPLDIDGRIYNTGDIIPDKVHVPTNTAVRQDTKKAATKEAPEVDETPTAEDDEPVLSNEGLTPEEQEALAKEAKKLEAEKVKAEKLAAKEAAKAAKAAAKAARK